MKEPTRRIIRKRYLIVKILFQIGIVVGMVLLAMRPLLDGREIRLVVQGRDPRDLFRGDYIALNYEFNTLYLDSIPNDLDPGTQYDFGDELYLELKQHGRFHRPIGLWTTPPEKNLFMKVRVRYHAPVPVHSDLAAGKHPRSRGLITITGGIEEYFTNPDEARRLDSLIARGAVDAIQTVAYVMLSDDGVARIKKVRYGAAESDGRRRRSSVVPPTAPVADSTDADTTGTAAPDTAGASE